MLTVSTAGTYLVNWGVTSAGSSGTFAVTVNGVVNSATKMGLGGRSEKIIGMETMVTLSAGDVLTLRNLSGGAFTISAKPATAVRAPTLRSSPSCGSSSERLSVGRGAMRAGRRFPSLDLAGAGPASPQRFGGRIPPLVDREGARATQHQAQECPDDDQPIFDTGAARRREE